MSEREYVEVVPIGEVGDGAVVIGYNPHPAPHRSEFEIYWDWGDSCETVYLGGKPQVVALVNALNELIDRD